MLVAEIQGKISPNNPPHQRMEDVLTSHVFSAFRYLNNLQLPLAFLRQAKNLKGEKLTLVELISAQVCFWPRFSFSGIGYREPDALLLFEEKGDNKISIVIEAKYDAGLSNQDNGEVENAEKDATVGTSFNFGHQLADEYCGLMCGQWNLGEDIQQKMDQVDRRALIYLNYSL